MRTLFTVAALILFLGVGATPSAAAIIGISEAAFGPGSTLVTFSEVPEGTNGDGLTIGNSTFDWNGTGTIVVISSGPGNTNNITQPALLSTSNSGVLTISLSNYVNMLGYGYAILATVPVANATTIALFDGATPLGSLSFNGVPDPLFAGGFAGVFSDVAFNRVQVTFSTQGSAFDLDELRTASVTAAPEPATILLLGTGLLGAGVRRWRQVRT